MDDEARSSEERLYAKRCRRLAAESRRLALEVAATAGQVARVERDVSSVHEILAASHPAQPQFADKAAHARRSAENAEAFATVERKVASTDDPAEAQDLFQPYQPPTPPVDR